MSIYTSLLTAGTNSHAESSENGNAVATDLLSPGVHGVITNTSGVAPTTGDFGVNAQASPNMTVAVNSGIAYVTATPSSQNSQNLRVRNTASANVTISANSSGSTKYDWLYIQVDATKAANPASDASDVATLVTSRSSSSTTDNGTPPTYGTLLAIVTVANGASSITNGNIADKRVRSVAVGGINDTNGNEVVRISATASAVNDITATNAATGNAPKIAASGDDTNIDLTLASKGAGNINLTPAGAGRVVVNGAGVGSTASVATSQTTTSTSFTDLGTSGPAVTATIGASGLALVYIAASFMGNSSTAYWLMGFAVSGNSTVAANDTDAITYNTSTTEITLTKLILATGLTAGSNTFTAKYRVTAGTGTWQKRTMVVIPL